jgi:hypothetical protein
MAYEITPFRILWAKAIDEYRTALAVEFDGIILGGIAFLRNFEMQMQGPRRCSNFGNQPTWFEHESLSANLSMNLLLKDFRVVPSAEWYEREGAWREHSKLAEQRQLPALEER